MSLLLNKPPFELLIDAERLRHPKLSRRELVERLHLSHPSEYARHFSDSTDTTSSSSATTYRGQLSAAIDTLVASGIERPRAVIQISRDNPQLVAAAKSEAADNERQLREHPSPPSTRARSALTAAINRLVSTGVDRVSAVAQIGREQPDLARASSAESLSHVR